jgi:hypothetical protein
MSSSAGQIVGGVIIPGLVHYIKHVHFQLTFAVFMQTLFFGLATLITPTNLHWLMAVQFFAMLPFGWITLNCYTTASLHVPQRDLGVAIGLIGTFRSLGGAIGSVIFSSIFSQIAAKQIATRIGETVAAASLPADSVPGLIAATRLTILGIPDQAAQFPDIPASVYASCVTAARYDYAYGFRITWLASIPFGIIAVLAAISVRDPSKYFTNHVEVHLEKEIGGKQREGKEFKDEHDEAHEATAEVEEKQTENGAQV